MHTQIPPTPHTYTQRQEFLTGLDLADVVVCGVAGSVPPLVVVLVIDGHAVRVAALVVGMTGVPVGEVGLQYIQSTRSSTPARLLTSSKTFSCTSLTPWQP